MSEPTPQQIAEIQNDPYITQGTKDALMNPFVNREEAYAKAIAERDANAAGDKEQKADVAKAERDLDAMAPPADGGSTTKSDEVLDLGNPALDFFSDWAEQVWNKMPEKSYAIDYKTDIWDKFHENREINFQKMFDEVEDLTDAKKAVEQTKTDATSALTTLFHDWKGEGATAAKVKYEQRIQPDAQELLDQMEGVVKLVPSTIGNIYRALKSKVDETLKLRVDKVATAPMYVAKQVIEVANGKIDSKEKLLDIAYWLDAQCPGNNLASRLRSDDCDLNDENREYASGAAKQWLKGSFAVEFGERYEAFKELCNNTTETINTQYHELSRFMEDYTNPFPAASAGTEQTPGSDGNGNGDGSGTPPGGGGGTPPGGGGGGGTPPSASIPEAPSPEDKPAEGMNPVTGKPLEIDPETGKPYPIDPATGEAIKDGLDGQDTMTVQKGDNTIEMSEPDKDGKMDIKVDDGKGNEKDYKLDFDDPKAEGEGKPGEEGKDPKDADFGPEGAVKEGEPGADGVYRPGPDGKIHIQDGNLKITAEQPQGPNGPTVVTVDDGKGEPTTYTLDEKGEKTELKPGDDLTPGDNLKDANGLDDRDPGNPQPDKLEDVRTMPAPGDGPVPGEGGFSAPGGVEVGGGAGGGVGGEGTAAVSAEAEATAGGAGAPTGDSTAPAASGGGGSFEGALGGVGGDSAGSLNEAGSLEAGAQTGGGAQPSGADSGLGMAPGGMDSAPAGAGAGSSSGMGGGMMGGMGAMGGAPGGGGGGGDTQRGSSQYRVEGGIFETSGAGGRISGSLDDEGDRSISYER